MHPKFLEWALDYLDSQKGQEKKDNKIIKENITNQIKKLEKQISSLIMMRAKDLLGDDEYLKEKKKIQNKIEEMREKENNKPSEDEIIELTKDSFIFSAHALKKLETGEKEVKREVLAKLGSNHVIFDKKPSISIHKWLLPIYNSLVPLNAEIARLEPTKTPINTKQKEAFASLIPRLHGW